MLIVTIVWFQAEAETVVCALLHKLPQITRKDWQDEVIYAIICCVYFLISNTISETDFTGHSTGWSFYSHNIVNVTYLLHVTLTFSIECKVILSWVYITNCILKAVFAILILSYCADVALPRLDSQLLWAKRMSRPACSLLHLLLLFRCGRVCMSQWM